MLINELEKLEDILDTIVAEDEEEPRLLDSDDEVECVETCMQLMSDYIDENPTAISEPDFHEEMVENIKELFLIEFGYFFFDTQRENFEEELEEIIEVSTKLFHSQIIPQRSYDTTFIKTVPNIEKIEEQIIKLKNKPQPTQRTKEWYEHRHNLITASNAYKAFENQNTQNQLIWEKCQGYDKMMLQEEQDHNVDNTNNTNIVDGILDVNCKLKKHSRFYFQTQSCNWRSSKAVPSARRKRRNAADQVKSWTNFQKR